MPTILIIEDEKDLSEAITQALGEEGYKVTLFSTSKAGLESAKDNKSDLILLDIMTGSLHGIEFLKELRALPEGLNDSKVIVLTNLDNDITRDQIIKYSVDDYIVKANSSIENIVNKVKKVLSEQ